MPRARTILERSLLGIGVILCLVYVGGQAYRAVGSRLAVRAFRNSKQISKPAAQRPVAPSVENLLVDSRLWSAKRIKAHEDALARQFAPPLAVLRISKLGIEVPVFEGTDELVLNRGVGWIAGTARPGQPGNIGIAGHRDGFFRRLKDIAVGDPLTLDDGVETAQYVVERITIVKPSGVSVLAPTATSSLTLVTCYPFYFVGSAPQRFIVQCSRETQAQTIPNAEEGK